MGPAASDVLHVTARDGRQVEIREADAESVPEIVALAHDVIRETFSSWAPAIEVEEWLRRSRGSEHFAQLVEDPSSALFVAVLDRRIVGTGFIRRSQAAAQGFRPKERCEAYMGGLYVDPSHRRIGVGDALVCERMGWAARAKLKVIRTEIVEANEPVRTLLEGHGFTATGRHRGEVFAFDWLVMTGYADRSETRLDGRRSTRPMAVRK